MFSSSVVHKYPLVYDFLYATAGILFEDVLHCFMFTISDFPILLTEQDIWSCSQRFASSKVLGLGDPMLLGVAQCFCTWLVCVHCVKDGLNAKVKFTSWCEWKCI